MPLSLRELGWAVVFLDACGSGVAKFEVGLFLAQNKC